ncbi:MAG: THxN family PEP-CTERM protein [Parahaliea sp.]
MKTSLSIKQLAVGVGLGVAMMNSASAALITSFDATQEFEWTEPTTWENEAAGNYSMEGATVGASAIDGYTKLAWGIPSTNNGSNPNGIQSSVVINAIAGDPTTPSNELTSGSVDTSTSLSDVHFAPGPVVTHNNFVQQGGSTALNTTSAQDNVVLSAAGNGVVATQSITFGVDFKETMNNVGQTQAEGCYDGVAWTAEDGCGDIFVVDGILGTPVNVIKHEGEHHDDANPSFTPVVAFEIDSFTLDGYLYRVLIREAEGALGVLSDAACAVAGAESGCIGFTTFENQNNSFSLEYAILASPVAVAAPATLALLAGSLLMMGSIRRKQA